MAIHGVSSVPTVFLLGDEHLPLIPEYLQLGSVVVVAPDRDLLRRWTREKEETRGPGPTVRTEGNLVVDLDARRVLIDDRPVSLSDLEFRVLAALLARPGRAWSFRDLRQAGWGEGPDLFGDDQIVKALVQRLRNKLRTSGARVSIEAVRSFGFRAEAHHREERSLTGVPMPTDEPTAARSQAS
jgi:DNA-binding winged helix-turn-helix (wHTH) protein